jgi:hypothetical protein
MTDRSDLLSAVDDMYTDSSAYFEFVKLQIDFWSKLVVLDAATLALSFTASAFFRDHLLGDGGIGYLVAAWKTLAYGISFSLVAQWWAIPGAASMRGHYAGMRVLTLLNRAFAESAERGERLEPNYVQLSSAVVSKSPKLHRRGQIYGYFAGVSGLAGLVFSLAAFYWLYRFAAVNVSVFRHHA